MGVLRSIGEKQVARFPLSLVSFGIQVRRKLSGYLRSLGLGGGNNLSGADSAMRTRLMKVVRRLKYFQAFAVYATGI